MKNDNDRLEEIQHSLSGMKGHLRILETNVPVETQMEYFRVSEKVRKASGKQPSIEDQIDLVNTPDASAKEKKTCMVALAHSGDVHAYRALESYAEHPDPELKDWAAMALMEARVSLEAELSDEKQIFISTGLGGRDSKLRFFALMKSKKLKPFSPYQKDLIEREIPFQIEKNDGIVDQISVEENYITLLFLMEINANIKYIMDNAILECNQYGDFIDSSYLITNVKIFDRDEIQKELRRKPE